MASANKYPGIDPSIVACVRHHARRATAGIAGLEIEDVEQELMLHVHRRLPRFDPEQATLRTFVDRIVANFAANLIETSRSAKRGSGIAFVPLDEINRDNEAAAGRVEYRIQSWCGALQDAEAQQMLRHDLERLLATLPKPLRQCCEWLATGTITSAAKESGLARGAIYGRIAALRRRCQEAGLKDYLMGGPTLPESIR